MFCKSGGMCRDTGLLMLRLGIGAIFLVHGIQKLTTLWGATTPDMPANMLMLMRFLSIVEPLGGLALILGFFTQWAAFGLALIMLGAIYFKIRMLGVGFVGKAGAGWEFDLALLAANVCLLFSGPGKNSIDAKKDDTSPTSSSPSV